MGFGDDIKNTAEDLAGKAKEAFGKVTGNDDAEREGKADQFDADAKDKASDVKDAFRDTKQDTKDAFEKAGDGIKAKVEDMKRDN